MLNCHTHCQVAQVDPQAKTWQRVCLSQPITDRRLERKQNTERTTSCIKHLAISGLSSVSARIKSSCNLIGNRFEMPNVSYTQPLCVMLFLPHNLEISVKRNFEIVNGNFKIISYGKRNRRENS